jgi:rod shape-determining protein MreD
MNGLRGSARLILAVFALLLVQTAFGRVLAPYPFTPVLALPIVFALATAPGVRVLRGALTVFFIGYLYDLFTGNPLGIHTFLFVVGYLVAWLVGYLFSFRGVPFEMLLTFVMSLALGGLLEAVRSFVPGGMSWSASALVLSLFGSAIVTALVAPIGFAVTRRLDPAAERTAS